MLPGGMEQRQDAGEGSGGQQKRACDVHATLHSIQRRARFRPRATWVRLSRRNPRLYRHLTRLFRSGFSGIAAPK